MTNINIQPIEFSFIFFSKIYFKNMKTVRIITIIIIIIIIISYITVLLNQYNIISFTSSFTYIITSKNTHHQRQKIPTKKTNGKIKPNIILLHHNGGSTGYTNEMISLSNACGIAYHYSAILCIGGKFWNTFIRHQIDTPNFLIKARIPIIYDIDTTTNLTHTMQILNKYFTIQRILTGSTAFNAHNFPREYHQYAIYALRTWILPPQSARLKAQEIVNTLPTNILIGVHRRTVDGECMERSTSRPGLNCNWYKVPIGRERVKLLSSPKQNLKQQTKIFTQPCNYTWSFVSKQIIKHNLNPQNITLFIASDRQDRVGDIKMRNDASIQNIHILTNVPSIFWVETWILVLSTLHFGNVASTSDIAVALWRSTQQTNSTRSSFPETCFEPLQHVAHNPLEFRSSRALGIQYKQKLQHYGLIIPI